MFHILDDVLHVKIANQLGDSLSEGLSSAISLCGCTLLLNRWFSACKMCRAALDCYASDIWLLSCIDYSTLTNIFCTLGKTCGFFAIICGLNLHSKVIIELILLLLLLSSNFVLLRNSGRAWSTTDRMSTWASSLSNFCKCCRASCLYDLAVSVDDLSRLLLFFNYSLRRSGQLSLVTSSCQNRFLSKTLDSWRWVNNFLHQVVRGLVDDTAWQQDDLALKLRVKVVLIIALQKVSCGALILILCQVLHQNLIRDWCLNWTRIESWSVDEARYFWVGEKLLSALQADSHLISRLIAICLLWMWYGRFT